MAAQKQELQPLSRWSPWQEMDRFQREMDDAMSRFSGMTPLSRFLPGVHLESDISPDVFESDTEFVFAIPAPGMDAEHVHVEATRDTLSVRGERKPLFEQDGARHIRQSIWSASHGSFEWQFALPAEVDPDHVSASWKKGVLEIHLPKAESSRPRPVPVAIKPG